MYLMQNLGQFPSAKTMKLLKFLGFLPMTFVCSRASWDLYGAALNREKLSEYSMLLDPNFESYPVKILKALGLEKDFRDKYRSADGILVMEKIATKEEIEVPFEFIEIIRNNRGYMQLAALEEFKRILLSAKARRSS
jgi:hypothetical protein